MTRIERRVFRNSVMVGLLVTLCVLAAQVLGWLQSPENWMYDLRARRFQFYTDKPTDALVHVDIDDGALEGIGRWPWPRQQMAELIDEMRLAGARAIALDVIYPDPQQVDHEIRTRPDGTEYVGRRIDHDGLFADAVRRAGNVVIPASVPLRRDETDPLRQAIIEQLTADLELTAPELIARLQAEGVGQGDLDRRVAEQYIPLRREAAYRRIRREMATRPLTPDELRSAILRRTQADIASPLSRLIDEQYERYANVQAALALARPPTAGDAPLARTEVYLAPVARFSAAAAGTAFVDFQPSPDGILRSVPLLVDCQGRTFPHLGLGLALQYHGVGPESLSFDGRTVTITHPGGPTRIPVRTIRSAALGRDIPAIMDLPWFGTGSWQTMYDWPGHQQTLQHVSMKAVWEPCLIRQKIARNNATLDRATADIARVLGVKLPAEKLADDDSAGRLRLVELVQKDAMYEGWRDQYRAMSATELNKDADGLKYLAAVTDIDSIRGQNATLHRDLVVERAKLAGLLKDKAVLVGFTATGNQDAVATSLHGICPGVIAHGVVFNSILTQQFWRSAPRWVNLLVTAVLGVLTALVAGRLSWHWAFLIASVMGTVFVLINGLLLFDKHNLLLDLAAPQIAMLAVWFTCSLVRIYLETVERKRVERRFRSYVDPAVVNYMLERGTATLDGESREMTVCFGDLAGFTALSERLGEKTVGMLNELWSLMVPILRDHNGRLDKFLGDGIMFFFGAPETDHDHAVNAVRTALKMQEALETFNQELRQRHLPGLKMRIGINTGLMIVGDAGSKDPQASNYTVLGDAVNFASRLESLNKQIGTSILISARTAQLIGDQFLLRPVGVVQVVGKTEVVLTFEVCGLAGTADERQRNLCDHTRDMIENFRGGQFQTVLKLLDQLDQTHGPSKLTALYRDLAESYLTNPPQQPFDGKIVFAEK